MSWHEKITLLESLKSYTFEDFWDKASGVIEGSGITKELLERQWVIVGKTLSPFESVLAIASINAIKLVMMQQFITGYLEGKTITE